MKGERAHKLLELAARFIHEHGRSITYREAAASFGRTPSTIHSHAEYLRKRGLLMSSRGHGASLVVTEEGYKLLGFDGPIPELNHVMSAHIKTHYRVPPKIRKSLTAVVSLVRLAQRKGVPVDTNLAEVAAWWEAVSVADD